MMYAPHILQKRVAPQLTNDEYGRPVVNQSEEWEDVCRCRCDDNTTQEFKSENGEVYRPNYHVVCEKNAVMAGDMIRCMDGDSVRGKGEVFIAKNTNYFGYTELWM